MLAPPKLRNVYMAAYARATLPFIIVSGTGCIRNNLGNVYMATGRYDEAVAQYTRATQLAPAFSFAAANKTLGLYAAGQTDESMREMRCAPW